MQTIAAIKAAEAFRAELIDMIDPPDTHKRHIFSIYAHSLEKRSRLPTSVAALRVFSAATHSMRGRFRSAASCRGSG
jgi:hypothetical protein